MEARRERRKAKINVSGRNSENCDQFAHAEVSARCESVDMYIENNILDVWIVLLSWQKIKVYIPQIPLTIKVSLKQGLLGFPS